MSSHGTRRSERRARVAIGEANVAEAPGGLRRFFRFSQLAVGEAGVSRKIEDIWATVLQELEDSGVPGEAVERLKSLGATNVIGRGGRVPESVVKLAGGKENLAVIKDTMRAAKASLQGLPTKGLDKIVGKALDELAKLPEFAGDDGARIIAELRKADPALFAKAGANQAISALSERGQQPFVAGLYQKILKTSPAKLPPAVEATLAEAVGGTLPTVTTGARKGLAAAGVEGVSGAANVARKGLGIFGKSALGAAGVGVIAALEINRAGDILGREGRAKKLALAGFQGLGPSSSVDFLRDTVRQQEAVSRRQLVMQQFNPDLFQQVVRALSDTGDSKATLTSSERRIGGSSPTSEFLQKSRGRDPKDVEFLLENLFRQMG